MPAVAAAARRASLASSSSSVSTIADALGLRGLLLLAVSPPPLLLLPADRLGLLRLVARAGAGGCCCDDSFISTSLSWSAADMVDFVVQHRSRGGCSRLPLVPTQETTTGSDHSLEI